MAIDGIGGVGALNVSSTVRPAGSVKKAEPVELSAQADVTAAGGNLQVEAVKPVATKGDAGSDKKNNGDGRDEAAVQYEGEVSKEKIQDAVEDLNKQIKTNAKHTNLSFKYHDETNRISITVTDSDTDEVIREIPPEKALDMLAKAWEMAGLLVDEKR